MYSLTYHHIGEIGRTMWMIRILLELKSAHEIETALKVMANTMRFKISLSRSDFFID